jgi:hypothetical protein
MRKDPSKSGQEIDPEKTDRGKDLAKVENNLPVADGFDGFEDGVEGDDQQERTSVIQGTLVRFTNDFVWMTNDDDELPSTLELIGIDVLRVVQKWGVDGKPAGAATVLAPGQRFPNVEKMNEEAPRSEWVEKFGKMVGPYQRQHVCYLLDPATLNRFTFPTSSTGGTIAVSELVDRVKWMRRFRGAHIYPVVTLAAKHMNTAYGGRERPHFIIKRWVNLDDSGNLLSPPADPTSGDTGAENDPAGADKKKDVATEDEKKAVAAQIGKPVTPPSYAEEMNDELPF